MKILPTCQLTLFPFLESSIAFFLINQSILTTSYLNRKIFYKKEPDTAQRWTIYHSDAESANLLLMLRAAYQQVNCKTLH
ncbi:hypothetical protein HMPREF9554_02959 [Treponema phagedenis F0421]|nr:hypothetical protein HMPREF9554_02959 [Treponema phagedenis F0421]